jgi:hypothetical protein
MSAEKSPRHELEQLLGLTSKTTPASPDLAWAKLGGWWTKMLLAVAPTVQSLTCFELWGSST